ncbi:hypothetical protein G3A_05885 [Bacillus sp. 17376]|nr:hypothetical protein G3A_05885 [Bacillus sp. 17376]
MTGLIFLIFFTAIILIVATTKFALRKIFDIKKVNLMS